jgi:hypothetical protein
MSAARCGGGRVNEMLAASNMRKRKAADAEAPAASSPARVTGYAVFEIKRLEDQAPRTNVSEIKRPGKQFWKTVPKLSPAAALHPRSDFDRLIYMSELIGKPSTITFRLHQSKRSIEHRHRTIYDSEKRVPTR